MLCTYRSDLWCFAAHYENLYLHPFVAIKTAESLLKLEIPDGNREHNVRISRESARYALKDIHGFMETANQPGIKDTHPEYLEARDLFQKIKPYIKKARDRRFGESDVGKCDAELERLREIMYGKAETMWANARSL